MSSHLKRLRDKNITVIYRELDCAEPFRSSGKCLDANPSFVVLRDLNNLLHFISIDSIIRLSEKPTKTTQKTYEAQY